MIINVNQFYPKELFRKVEGLELLIKSHNSEEKQHSPYKKPFEFEFQRVKKDLKFEVKVMNGVNTVASGEINISVLVVLERREVTEQLCVLEFNQIYKKKTFGLIP